MKDSLIPQRIINPARAFSNTVRRATPQGTPAFASGSGHPPPPQGPRGVNSGDFT